MAEIEMPNPSAQRLLGAIAGQIASGRIQPGRPETFLTLSEAMELSSERMPADVALSRMSSLDLYALRLWTAQHEELPKVAGLIVQEETRRPHKVFLQCHGHGDDPDWERWWLEEAARAIAYDWSPLLNAGSQYSSEQDRTREDIRASLAYAADRESQAAEAEGMLSRLSQVSRQWKGLTLPKSDPDDPRMDYLLERYWRNRE